MKGTILVTGCGGDIGTGIGRILKGHFPDTAVIGADGGSDHPGAAFFSRCFLLPKVTEPHYLERLAALIRDENVQLVIPASEPELRSYANGWDQSLFGATRILAANRQSLDVGFDKLATARFLAGRGLPAPWCGVVGEETPQAFPCILKSRTGSGSKTVLLIHDSETAKFHSERRKGELWQEYLPGDENEHTCGLFRAASGEIRSIVFKRKLQGGLTGSGVVVENPVISSLLKSLAEALSLRGSINVQLRTTSRGPVTFEINPRFSSTVVFRDRLGFTDVLWSIQDLLGQTVGAYAPPETGTRFYRCANEVIIPAQPERKSP